jgi:hypothetical protein
MRTVRTSPRATTWYMLALLTPIAAAASEARRVRRRAWARVLRKVDEVSPLTCPKCGTELKIISVILDPVDGRWVGLRPGLWEESRAGRGVTALSTPHLAAAQPLPPGPPLPSRSH